MLCLENIQGENWPFLCLICSTIELQYSSSVQNLSFAPDDKIREPTLFFHTLKSVRLKTTFLFKLIFFAKLSKLSRNT